RIPEYKALVGDTSDNIPGVPGIGAKTATALVQAYDSLEAMREHIDEIKPPRARASLAEHFEQALHGRELATVVRDIDLELDLDTCVLGDYDRDRVLEVFRELEFRTLVNRLPEPTRPQVTTAPPAPPAERTIVRFDNQLGDLLEELRSAPAIALDVETTSTDPMTARLVGIALAASGQRSFYVPVNHANDDEQLDADEVREALSPLLADPNTVVYAHHGKYDALVLERAGYPRPRIAFDTMIAAYLLGENALDLKSLAFNRLGMEMTEITTLIGRGRNQL